MSFCQSYNKVKENVGEHVENKAKSTPIAMVAPEVKQNSDVSSGITKACAVLGCDDSKNLDAESFFRFPEDANLKQIWTDLTGRNNWTPTDYSYICIQHFSVDCFTCNADNVMVLVDKAVPSLKLPRHVLEVEYIDEETLDNEDDYMDSDEDTDDQSQTKPVNGDHVPNPQSSYRIFFDTNGYDRYPDRSTNSLVNDKTNQANNQVMENDSVELLKLFTEVQKMQRHAVGLKDKLKANMRVQNRQSRFLKRLQEMIERKRSILNEKRKKKSRILLSLKDKIQEDATGLVLAMPVRQTEDLKNFAVSIYKYSPQAYVYVRNTLRTMLPSTEVLDSWISAGYQTKNLLTNSNLVKVVAEQTESELSCKVTIA